MPPKNTETAPIYTEPNTANPLDRLQSVSDKSEDFTTTTGKPTEFETVSVDEITSNLDEVDLNFEQIKETMAAVEITSSDRKRAKEEWSLIKRLKSRRFLGKLALLVMVTSDNGPVNMIYDAVHSPGDKIEQVMEDNTRYDSDILPEELAAESADYPMSSVLEDKFIIEEVSEVMDLWDKGEEKEIRERAAAYRENVIEAGGFSEEQISELKDQVNSASSQAEMISITQHFFEAYSQELSYTPENDDEINMKLYDQDKVGNSREVVSSFIDFASLFPPEYFYQEFGGRILTPVESLARGVAQGVTTGQTIYVASEGLVQSITEVAETVPHEFSHTGNTYSYDEGQGSALLRYPFYIAGKLFNVDTEPSLYGVESTEEYDAEIAAKLIVNGPPNPNQPINFEHTRHSDDLLNLLLKLEEGTNDKLGSPGFTANLIEKTHFDKQNGLIPIEATSKTVFKMDTYRALVVYAFFYNEIAILKGKRTAKNANQYPGKQ